MPKPKVKVPKGKPPAQPFYDYRRWGLPVSEQQPLGTMPGARNVPYTVGQRPVIGTPLQRPLTGTPGATPWTGAPTGVGGAKVPWWKPTGAGMGRLASLGKFIPGWGQVAIGMAVAGTELWKALTPEFQAYVDAGGTMGQLAWQRAGRPKTPQDKGGEGITAYAEEVLTRPKKTQEQLDTEASDRLTRETLARGIEREEAAWALPIPGGATEGAMVTLPDGSTGFWTRDERGYPFFNPITRGQKEGRERLTPYGTNPYDIPETEQVEGQFNPYTGEWEPPVGYVSPGEKQRRTEWEAEQKAKGEYEDRYFQWQQDQLDRQLAAQKQEQLARLRANPASWLEYASLAGQTPVIQPWMLPLMPQQYTGAQAGGAIPGYQAGGERMNLPGLITPSAQYMSRISPSMRQQYYGYEQARTGATPEDVSWRLWSQAPPGGRYTGLRRMR